jgi:hypothetical protein
MCPKAEAFRGQQPRPSGSVGSSRAPMVVCITADLSPLGNGNPSAGLEGAACSAPKVAGAGGHTPIEPAS